MAVRPLIRPRPRVTAPTAMPAIDSESLANLPRVLSRVSDCGGSAEQTIARAAPRQPMAKPVVTMPITSTPAKSPSQTGAGTKPTPTAPTLPEFWQSRKVLVAASILALVTAVAIGYQFRPKQQVIVVHPAKQPAAIATAPGSSFNTANSKPAFQPLTTTPAATTPAKETTSTASLMPRATWPAEKSPAASPAKNTTPAVQTATKPIDTRTSMNQTPNFQQLPENLPRMSPQFPQATNPVTNSPSNATVVYNPTLNAATSPLASNAGPQNNQPPQYGSQQFAPQQNGAPQYTAALPNVPQNMQPSQPLPPPDGSFGAYGGARFEGQIQPLLRR